MKSNNSPIVIDDTDRRILEVLQHDASISNQELAARCETSPATCLRRVRRLVETGVVVRRVALLDAERLGPTLRVITEVTLDRQGVEHLDAFERRAIAETAVRQCYRVSPGPDFVLFAEVRDMDAWAALVGRLFTQDANVRNVRTFFSVRRAKFDTAVDVPQEPRRG